MKPEPTVDAIMARRLRTVTAEYTLADVQEIFAKEQFRHLPVLDGNRLVGMISRTDLMRITYGVALANDAGDGDEVNDLLLASTSVGEAMSTHLFTIETGAPATEAARIMVHEKINAVPVLDGNDLIGMVTSTDLLNEYIKLYHH